MILPQCHGNLPKVPFVIYAACDAAYFDSFGLPFLNSVKANCPGATVHIHLFNPTQVQLAYCATRQLSFSYEYAPIDLFKKAEARWTKPLATEFEKTRHTRIIKSMAKGGDVTIAERLQKTYYACARFIRIPELGLDPSTTLFAIDIDAVAVNPIPLLPAGPDLYIHKNTQFLAGGLYLPAGVGVRFFNEYRSALIAELEADNIYWSLDQDVLDTIVPQYNYAELPRAYIDWNMQPDSYIWTAKGTRKNLAVFIAEQTKYKSL